MLFGSALGIGGAWASGVWVGGGILLGPLTICAGGAANELDWATMFNAAAFAGVA
ncbi:MAG TPA: hypothetical protein VNX60_14560 [Candidatus Acidoferrum sp.]|nr:hypothetical protein [Candidatus Acidoferrum sp.]